MPPALPGALALHRALRPLGRRAVPDGGHALAQLDEEATVELTAASGFRLPVLRPAPTRWLDVALVVDDSVSMGVWDRSVREFRALLQTSRHLQVGAGLDASLRGDPLPRGGAAPWHSDGARGHRPQSTRTRRPDRTPDHPRGVRLHRPRVVGRFDGATSADVGALRSGRYRPAAAPPHVGAHSDGCARPEAELVRPGRRQRLARCENPPWQPALRSSACPYRC